MTGMPVASLTRTISQHSSREDAPPTSIAGVLPCRMASTAMGIWVCQLVKMNTVSISSRALTS